MKAQQEDIVFNVRYDKFFKYIFGEQAFLTALKILIIEVLKLPPDECDRLTILPSDSICENKNDKQRIMDILVMTKSGILINIEMQKFYVEGMENRFYDYATLMLSKQIKKGELYNNMRKVYSIIIFDFCHNKLPDEKYLHHHLVKDDDNGVTLFDRAEFYTIELPKLQKYGDNSLLCNLLRLLLCTIKKELAKIVEEEPKLKEIADRIIKWTDEDIAELNEFRRMMREEERIAIEKQELAKEQALIEKGKTEGKTEALIERARIALRKNTDLKTISALLGLSMTTLKHLAAEEKLQKPPKRLKK